MASPVGAILFLHPFPTSISHFPFSTPISHSHFPLPRLLPSARYPMAATLWLRVCTPSGQCQVPILPEPLPDGAPLECPGQKPLRHSAPASNKPHPAEKSTSVWLAIWRTWAGFANSQLLNAAFSSTNNICWIFPCSTLGCRSDRRKSVGPSAPIAYATSVSPPDEAIAWPCAQVFGAG